MQERKKHLKKDINKQEDNGRKYAQMHIHKNKELYKDRRTEIKNERAINIKT